MGKRRIVFSGDADDTGAALARLARLARGADLLVAAHAIDEDAAVERQRHLRPSAIGALAAEGQVKRVVLTHRNGRTLGREADARAALRARYEGPVVFADDLDCFILE